jgi:hypothetical protein
MKKADNFDTSKWLVENKITKNISESIIDKIKNWKQVLSEGINNSFKKGDFLFYKNQYMDKPKNVVVSNVEEYSNGEIGSITIKFESGNESRLLPYEFKYLSKQKQKEDVYDIVKKINNQISDIVGYTPRQTSGLFKFIKENKNTDTINITFIEEIKDGRTPKFNINSPFKLKNITLGTDSFKFKIKEINFNNQHNQESDYNEYINYVYNVVIEKVSG